MSYVAPVQLDQYVQYANRMVRHKQDYAELTSVARIELNTKSLEEEKKFSHMLEKVKRSKLNQELYMKKMTGNGQLFNDSI